MTKQRSTCSGTNSSPQNKLKEFPYQLSGMRQES